MEKEKIQRFKDQIWTTRVSRVNAERRLINKEKFFQAINVYYSCVTVIFSILAFINKDDKLSIITMFMTISLLVVILYLNSQKYLEYARAYRENYTELQRLEFKLEHINENDECKIVEIENAYCDLLDSSSNHIPFDFFCCIHDSKGDFKETRWKSIKSKYYVGKMWRFALELFIVLLPFVLLLICEVV